MLTLNFLLKFNFYFSAINYIVLVPAVSINLALMNNYGLSNTRCFLYIYISLPLK